MSNQIEEMREQLVAKAQAAVDKLGVGGLKNNISDGYHNFGELYQHRIQLFITLCKHLRVKAWPDKNPIFRTTPKDGWFILGIDYGKGNQITYHIPVSELSQVPFAEINDSFVFDGHTSKDVLERLKNI